VRSFFDTFPLRLSDFEPPVVLCPEGGKLGRDFKPVPVEPWAPEPRRKRPRAKRPISLERVEEINATKRTDGGRGTHPDFYPDPRYPDPRRGRDSEQTPELVELLEHGELDDADREYPEPYEFEDRRYFEPAEARGVRSLMQPRMSSSDYSWRAPAARCRSCGCETWVASIADGIRMIRNPRHRKGCSAPPNRLEVEQSCAT